MATRFMHPNLMPIDGFIRLSALAGLLAVFAFGCGTAREAADAQGTRSECTVCHGGLDNQTGAPPVLTNGETTGPAVGAHTKHMDAKAGDRFIVPCESCHVVPTNALHGQFRSRATVTFSGLATAGGATPQYDAATYTCSNVYCHGGTINSGGTHTAPAWGESLAHCGTCHGYPPPSPHPNNVDCHSCHALSVDTDNFTWLSGHLNGRVDFDLPTP